MCTGDPIVYLDRAVDEARFPQSGERWRGAQLMVKDTIGLEGEASEDLKAKALVLEDLVSYQKGAVVSRTVVDKKAGTITIFSFDEGEGLSEHTAPYDATVVILDGKVEMTISGTPLVAKAGEMVIMPAGQPHALRALTPFKMALVMIRA